MLTRAFGLRYLDLVQDKVQEAMLAAMQTWSRRGIPRNPAGWIYRVARNRVLDALRREKIHQRALAHSHQTEGAIGAYRAARSAAVAPHERALLDKKLVRLQSG